MQEQKCSHSWQIVNVRPGFIITEKCFECNKITTYFSVHEPPLEEFRDKEHFWNVVETAQTVCFDLECHRCGQRENFVDLMGLMMCTGCNEKCEVDKLLKQLAPQRIWVYVAFSFLPSNEKPQLTEEKIAILENYFNQQRKSSRIKIVSNQLVENYATCYGEIIKDLDLLSLTPPDK